MIRFRAVSKRWTADRPWAVRHLDLEVADGEWLALIGASGGGKSTTLKLVNRMVEATEGVVEVRGQDVRAVAPEELRRGIGYVPQAIGLLPHWSVGENVGIVPHLLGWPADRIRARTDELLHDVGLDPALYRDRAPRDLSGGQSQRVAVARALAASPCVLLMDEPFGAVDPVVRDRLQELVRGLHERLKLTTVFVTHDMGEALRLADRVAVLDQGELVRLASPRELLASPGHPAVAGLLEAPKRHADALARLLP